MRTNQRQTEIPETSDSTLAPAHRRSKRILLDVPLAIRGEAEDQRPFQEETFTVTVSAHGALVVLERRVGLGQKVVLMNPKNWDEREATITYLGPCNAGLSKVGIQFTQPSPEFWLISSPPSDWNLS